MLHTECSKEAGAKFFILELNMISNHIGGLFMHRSICVLLSLHTALSDMG